ncbi:MAG: BLUF domain-containing protein [Cytophagales bacterium]|nr:BLUF domain-containing protein [Cytophagales bacterium]
MLSHIVYVSKRKSICTDAEIEKILASCTKNNPPLNITGVLLYSDQKFIQYVEGEYKNIMQLYDKIKLDPRHDSVAMVSIGPIDNRIFPSWNMGSKKVHFDNVNFITDISSDDKVLINNILSGKEESGRKVQSLVMKLFS